MSITLASTRLVLALFLKILMSCNRTTIAVTTSGQYSSYQAPTYFSQSLSGYGNENQHYFDNPTESGYSDETYARQKYSVTSYASSGIGGYDDGNKQNSYQEQESIQPHTTYHNYPAENVSPFQHEQDSSLDGYLRQFYSRHSANGPGTSAAVSFDNNDSNNFELGTYQAAEDVVYPPLDSGLHQHSQQQSTKQMNLPSSDYATSNHNMSPSLLPGRMNSQQSMSHQSAEKDNAFSTNTEAHMVVSMHRPPTSSKTIQMNIQQQPNAKTYIANDDQHLHDQQQIPRTSHHHAQPLSHLETQVTNNSDKPLNISPTSTYYVADSDLSFSSTNHAAESHPVSLLRSHFVQLPGLSSSSSHLPAVPQPSFAIPSEPIPISKHVEITKHVPVPIYRQVHVPYRKPIRIEIPRPVISTIPRPYPIHIPTLTKTVAVPLVKEVKIPIEKVTPYPVEHRVPYVVEKRVPFQVEKQVAAPVYYPFPVKVPMVRTILHKKKSHFTPLHYHSRYHM